MSASDPAGPNLFDPAWEFEGDGAMASPLHFHHGAEELLFVLAGEPTLRTGEDAGAERTLAVGEVVSFPPGRAGTHQIVNRGASTARVLICSTNDLPEVAEQVETGLTVVLTDEYDRLYRDGVDIRPEP